MQVFKLSWGLVPLLFIGCGGSDSSTKADLSTVTKSSLGQSLYHDTSLSQNREMSCATCHSETNVFIDKRETSEVGHASSVNADETKVGTRNVPSLTYVAYTPEFTTEENDKNETLVSGGLFWDGRASNLQEQAKTEFLDVTKMQMTSREEVIERVKANDNYVDAFRKLYGEDVFNDINESYDALTESIAAFEKTKLFSSFDSKYDRKLKGTYSFSEIEEKGLKLFSDTHKANCVACHPLSDKRGKALFTNYAYVNIGVPINEELQSFNSTDTNQTTTTNKIDYGLLNNGTITEERYEGAFKVPTLRNVAVTAPYMHNGVFKNLKTVVHFLNTRDLISGINPETDSPWEKSELSDTVNHTHMGALRLTDEDEDAIVAFLNTLTDERYEQ